MVVGLRGFLELDLIDELGCLVGEGSPLRSPLNSVTVEDVHVDVDETADLTMSTRDCMLVMIHGDFRRDPVLYSTLYIISRRKSTPAMLQRNPCTMLDVYCCRESLCLL